MTRWLDACPVPDFGPEGVVTLEHGAGGRRSRELFTEIFLPLLDNPSLREAGDQAVLPAPGGGPLALTTDGYVVRPYRFAGGSIGDLAVNGTVNDLAAGGARPLWLTASWILEEGLLLSELAAVVADMARSARQVGVPVVAGDTKVVERGHCDGLYISTTGVGVVLGAAPSPNRLQVGDRILVSGPVADHGATILVSRENLGVAGDLRSDTAALWPLVKTVLSVLPSGSVRAMRDPTRGGLATVLKEWSLASGRRILLRESQVPVRPPVRGLLDLLGLDPLYLACEGRMLFAIAAEEADQALSILRQHPLGREAAEVGIVLDGEEGLLLETLVGGLRELDLLSGDPLPRIC